MRSFTLSLGSPATIKVRGTMLTSRTTPKFERQLNPGGGAHWLAEHVERGGFPMSGVLITSYSTPHRFRSRI